MAKELTGKPGNEKSAEQVTVKQELETWADKKKLVALTLEGEEVWFPTKISLGKEIQLRNILSDKLSTIVGLFSSIEEDGELPEGAFSFFFKEFYDLLPELVSILVSTKGTQRSEEWVSENFDADTCQEIITPFFGSLLRMPPIQMLGAGPGMAPGADQIAGIMERAGIAGAPPVGVQKETKKPKKSRSPK